MMNAKIVNIKGVVKMKGHKLILCAICVFITIAAAVTAIIIFRNEITGFIVEIKSKIDEKKLQHNGEFADYADI